MHQINLRILVFYIFALRNIAFGTFLGFLFLSLFPSLIYGIQRDLFNSVFQVHDCLLSSLYFSKSLPSSDSVEQSKQLEKNTISLKIDVGLVGAVRSQENKRRDGKGHLSFIFKNTYEFNRTRRTHLNRQTMGVQSKEVNSRRPKIQKPQEGKAKKMKQCVVLVIFCFIHICMAAAKHLH